MGIDAVSGPTGMIVLGKGVYGGVSEISAELVHDDLEL